MASGTIKNRRKKRFKSFKPFNRFAVPALSCVGGSSRSAWGTEARR
jgi:hypothetical protein